SLRVHPDAVRRREPTGAARVGLAPGRQDIALGVTDTHLGRPVLRPDAPGQVHLALLPGHLADVDGAFSIHEQVARPGHVRPGGEQLAGRAEDLDAVVLAVADPDPAVGVRPDRV